MLIAPSLKQMLERAMTRSGREEVTSSIILVFGCSIMKAVRLLLVIITRELAKEANQSKVKNVQKEKTTS